MKIFTLLIPILRDMHLGLILTGLLTSHPVTAATVFSDDTFSLADYSIETFQSGGATINTSQTLVDGNPGPALQSVINVPSFGGRFHTSEYFLNKSFVYDISTNGPIQSINFTEDVFLEAQPSSIVDIRGVAGLVHQDGNYYIHVISTPAVNAVWQTGVGTELLATDFDLVTNLLTRQIDATMHPNFDEGIVQFGTIIGTVTGGNRQPTLDVRVDNLSYTISTVPLPTAAWLFPAGIAFLSTIAGRKKSRHT